MAPEMTTVLPYVIEFVAQTAFLFAGLWVMILIQKLNYSFLLLLGASALSSGLEMGLNKLVGTSYFGSMVSTPVIVGTLGFCIMKITRADHIDVVFTVAVGYALMFCLNLWLLGALLGDLRPDFAASAGSQSTGSLSEENEPSIGGEDEAERNHHTDAPHTVPPNKTVPGGVGENKVAGRLRTQGAAIRSMDTTKNWTVKSVIQNSGNSSIVIDTGVKSYTLFVGDRASMNTPKGTVAARFDGLVEKRVVLTVDGEQVKLPFP
jgi:hypothetical protein